MEIKCEKCGSEKMIVEGVVGGGVKMTCQKCGNSEVRDSNGSKMLLGESQNSGQLLTETMPL